MRFISGPLAWATAWPLTWTVALVLLTGPGTAPARAADARRPLSIFVLYYGLLTLRKRFPLIHGLLLRDRKPG